MAKNKQEPWFTKHDRKRNINNLPLRKRYLICTEGKTESLYFNHYKSSTGPIIIPLDKSDHKVSLIEKTILEKQHRISIGELDEEIDEVWVVLDRDSDPKNKFDKNQFNQALEIAKKNNISIAYSNDAFELWLLLHYQDLWSAKHRDELCEMLSKCRKVKYVKPCDLYHEIKSSRLIAINRALKLHNSASNPESSNPSTTVNLLV